MGLRGLRSRASCEQLPTLRYVAKPASLTTAAGMRGDSERFHQHPARRPWNVSPWPQQLALGVRMGSLTHSRSTSSAHQQEGTASLAMFALPCDAEISGITRQV
jgi:hypothetical protein